MVSDHSDILVKRRNWWLIGLFLAMYVSSWWLPLLVPENPVSVWNTLGYEGFTMSWGYFFELEWKEVFVADEFDLNGFYLIMLCTLWACNGLVVLGLLFAIWPIRFMRIWVGAFALFIFFYISNVVVLPALFTFEFGGYFTYNVGYYVWWWSFLVLAIANLWPELWRLRKLRKQEERWAEEAIG